MRKIVFCLLFLVVFTIPWENVIALGEFGTFTKAIGLLTAALGIVTVAIQARARRLIAIHYVMAIFASWACLSLIWSQAGEFTIERIKTFVQLLGLTWLIWEFAATERAQARLMQAYILGGCVGLLTQLITFLQLPGYRFTGGGLNANDYALTLAFSVPFAIHFGIAGTKKKNPFAVLYWVYASMAGIGVLLTGSRTGLIVLGLVTFFILSTYLRRQALVAVVMASVVAITAWAFIKWAPGQTVQRLGGTGEALGSTWSLRTLILAKGLQVASNNWFLGTGAGTFTEVIGTITEDEAHKYTHIAAHNTYLDVLVEMGVVGLLLFLAMLLMALSYARRLPKAERIIWTALLIGWDVGAIAGSIEDRKHLWFILGLVASRFVTMRDLSQAAWRMSVAVQRAQWLNMRWGPRGA